jgi:hypothetical protein
VDIIVVIGDGGLIASVDVDVESTAVAAVGALLEVSKAESTTEVRYDVHCSRTWSRRTPGTWKPWQGCDSTGTINQC